MIIGIYPIGIYLLEPEVGSLSLEPVGWLAEVGTGVEKITLLWHFLMS